MSRSPPRSARDSSSAAASSTRPRNSRCGAESGVMGAIAASLGLLADTITAIQNFIYVFVCVYVILNFPHVLRGCVRPPFSPRLDLVQCFLYDLFVPYL